MKLTRLAASAILLCASSSFAEENYLSRPTDQYRPVEGPGILFSDSSVLHPSFGAEVGLDSNVFREEADGVLSPLLRLSAALDIASLPPARLGLSENNANPILIYRVGLNASYNEFLSGNSNARSQRNLSLNAGADLQFFPKDLVTFRIEDDFNRLVRPRNFESDGLIPRDINHLRLSAGVQPGGRSIYIGLRYENLLDYFESVDSRFANRINHDIGARITWKWRPFTEFWLDGSYGFYGGFQTAAENYKVSSNPLRLRAGASSAITERLTLSLFGGYALGNYESGESFNGAIVGAQAGFRYSPEGRFLVSYNHDYQDSINANYFGEHVFKATIDQGIGRLVLNAHLAARIRGYRGIDASLGGTSLNRDDTIFDGGLGAKYWLSEKLVINATYYTVFNDTDFRTVINSITDDPSYRRNAIFLGANLAY